MNGLKHFAHVTLCLPLELIPKPLEKGSSRASSFNRKNEKCAYKR